MKKFFLILALCAVFVIAGCGGSKKENKNEETPDSEETVTDDDTADTDPTGDTEPSGDTEPTEKPDQDSPDTEPTEKPDQDSDAQDLEAIKKDCEASNGTFHNSEPPSCYWPCEDKPQNAKWNGNDQFYFEFVDGRWNSKIVPTEYNEEKGDCHFVCEEDFEWDQEFGICDLQGYQCYKTGGVFTSDGTDCIRRDTDCGEMPAHSYWNYNPDDIQYMFGNVCVEHYVDGEWPADGYCDTVYSEQPGACHFACDPEFEWDEEKGTCYNEEWELTEECYSAGGVMKNGDTTCFNTSDCADKPANSHWNPNPDDSQYMIGVHECVMFYADGKWPEEGFCDPVYSEDPGACHFVCDTGFAWNGTECKSPCFDPNPCDKGLDFHAYGCHAADDGRSYSCYCNTGYEWDSGSLTCRQDAPFATGLVWSEISPEKMSYTDAVSYCENLTQSGHSDWVIPKIAELRTVVRNCTYLMPSVLCEVSDFCSEASCNSSWCQCETNTEPGHFSRLADSERLWSGTTTAAGQAWSLDFGPSAQPSLSDLDARVRCVRHSCEAGKVWDGETESCVTPKTNEMSCGALSHFYTEWNTVSSVTQTWNSYTWSWEPPVNKAEYNTQPSTTACRFKCKEGYHWENSQCVSDTKTVSCTGLPAWAQWNSVNKITQTWVSTPDGGGYYSPVVTNSEGVYNTEPSTTECRYKCVAEYHWEDSKCRTNTKSVNCTGLPAYAMWNTSSKATLTWDYEANSWTEIPAATYSTVSGAVECGFKCYDQEGFVWNNSACVLNETSSRLAECTGLPANAQWNGAATITQGFNPSTNSWYPELPEAHYNTVPTYTAAEACAFRCSTDSPFYWDGSQCKAGDSYSSLPNDTLGRLCTGQLQCFNNSGKINCPINTTDDFFGQDAQYRERGKCRPHTFTEDNGTTLDNDLNLLWSQSSTERYSWEQAAAFCANLDSAGDSNWRLPTIEELISNFDVDVNKNSTLNYWSSTSFGVSSAWALLSYGFVSYASKSDVFFVKCVNDKIYNGVSLRKSSFSNDGLTVTDTVTGLMWQRDILSSQTHTVTWKEALEYCENLTTAGFSDWRLPNRNELISLINYEKANPASDFPNLPSGAVFVGSLWSSTTAPYFTVDKHAYHVDFYDGQSYITMPNTDHSPSVRCVR